MASHLPIPRPLNLTGNLTTNWNNFKRDWNNYEIASKCSAEAMPIRIATLLSCIGSDAMNIYDGFVLSDEERKDIKNILDAFEKYCIGETNETYERFIFNSRNQLDSENTDRYVAELRKLARTCNFQTLEEALIRDRLVMGVKCDVTRGKLLQEPNLTLTKAIDIARAIEVSRGRLAKIKEESSMGHSQIKEESLDSSINKMRQQYGGVKQNQRNGEKKSYPTCHFCSKSHPFTKKELCPAYGKHCTLCKGKNHFPGAKYCRRAIRVVDLQPDEGDSSQDTAFEDVWLATVGTGSPKSTANLVVNEQNVTFQLDTGADVNTICQRYVRQDQVKQTKTRLVMWNGTKMTPKGEVILKVFNPKTKSSHEIKFIVVRNDVSCLLGLTTLKLLQFITVHNDQFICSMNTSEQLGNLGETKLTLDPEKKPRQLPCRRIPFALQEKVKIELDHMVKRGILAPITEPTEWVSQMAIAEKSNGNIRICIDPVHLNDALQREHYKLPTLDDVLGEMKDARLFTKMDVKEAYWHVRLDEESSILTTMITPFGRFRWLRLPFGLKVSSEIFQKKLCDALDGLKNTINVADDIVLAGCGESDEEARNNLVKRTQELNIRCKERHIILNDKKTVAEEKEIIFMGHSITAGGISPDPNKVEAIQNMPIPTDVTAVRRLCGTIQYLARYIPHLSQHLEPLRKLTTKNAVWNWSSECQKAFDTVKSLIVEDTKLAYFNNDKEVHLQVDSSKDGIGAVLLQDGRPIEFASKALSNTQRRWAQIEKELLAVVVGLERFDQYTYGRKVYVQNDHKPLANILKKPLSETPRRLQNLLMRLHRYDIDFQYIEGPKLLMADTLSRAVGLEKPHEITELNISTVSSISDQILAKIRQATSEDKQLQTLINYITEGWPNKTEISPQVMPYHQIKDILSIEEDIIYKGEQVVIPTVLRPFVKEKLHAAHLGYDSMMRRVRTTVFWPGIRQEVKQISENCESCQRNKPQNQRETLIHHDEGSSPWQKIGADLCELHGQNYLIIVDYFSNYIEIERLTLTTAAQIIKKMKAIFARWGIPLEIVTDCGSQFLSEQFQSFIKDWGITHHTSSPYHHQSNGKAESAVKIIKNMIKKAHENNEDPFIGLLELRNTPRQDKLKTPAEIMLGRIPRTFLPKKPEQHMTPHERSNRKDAIKNCYDKKAKDLPEIPQNKPVYFRTPQNKWGAGKVNSRNGRQYKILSEDGTMYVRNRIHIRPKHTPFSESLEAILAAPDPPKPHDVETTDQIQAPQPEVDRQVTPSRIPVRQSRAGRYSKPTQRYSPSNH